MKLGVSKIAWVNHDNSPIYSIDFASDSKHFATSGGDNNIKIWNSKALINESITDKLLCTCSNHSGAVNVVLWSKSGRYLASGSDDSSVLIWEHSKDRNDSTENIENWKCASVLSFHKSDIQDVSWSPDEKYLASCSIDNCLVIWDVKEAKPFKTLTDHQGWITGCDWDPSGKLLATQSSDGSVIIWNTSTYQKIKKIKCIFENRQFSSKEYKINYEFGFSRLSFSPNSQFLATCYGYKQFYFY